MATFHENLVQSFANFKNKYIVPIQTALNNKQDKLTDPLTQSDVVNNLTSTSTIAPLSANQGKILKEYASRLGIDSDYLSSHSVTLSGDFTFSDLENSAVPMFFTNWEDSTNFPGVYGSGIFVPMLDNRHKFILYAYQTNGLMIRTCTAYGWNSWARILSSGNVADNLSTYSNIDVLSAKQGYIMSRDIPWYGACSTATSTIEKTATTSDSKFVLTTGAKVSIKFTYENTASAPTLNVDSTGAKSIKAYGTTAPGNYWKAGDVVNFIYDGTNWIMGATGGQISDIYSFIISKIGHRLGEITYQDHWAVTEYFVKTRELKTLSVNYQLGLSSASSGLSLGTINEGFRPASVIYFPCTVTDTNRNNVIGYGTIRISTAGNIAYYGNSLAFQNWIIFSGSYC